MKKMLCLSAVVLSLVSCVGTKPLTITTYPEGAEITINGEAVGKTPLTTEIAQDKTLGIVARKDGYEIGAATLSPVSSRFLSFIWTENDPKSKYIEEDSVTIALKKLRTTETYTPKAMPTYDGGGGSTKACLPEVPELRPMPELD
jgi:hypothetical protein